MWTSRLGDGRRRAALRQRARSPRRRGWARSALPGRATLGIRPPRRSRPPAGATPLDDGRRVALPPLGPDPPFRVGTAIGRATALGPAAPTGATGLGMHEHFAVRDLWRNQLEGRPIAPEPAGRECRRGIGAFGRLANADRRQDAVAGVEQVVRHEAREPVHLGQQTDLRVMRRAGHRPEPYLIPPNYRMHRLLALLKSLGFRGKIRAPGLWGNSTPRGQKQFRSANETVIWRPHCKQASLPT